jgi:hypothetical protein
VSVGIRGTLAGEGSGQLVLPLRETGSGQPLDRFQRLAGGASRRDNSVEAVALGGEAGETPLSRLAA